MAVPSSGELSLLGIRREVSGNNYNSSTNYTDISLANLCSGPFNHLAYGDCRPHFPFTREWIFL